MDCNDHLSSDQKDLPGGLFTVRGSEARLYVCQHKYDGERRLALLHYCQS